MSDRQLYASPLFTIAEFVCPASDDAWGRPNVIESPAPIVAFPHMAVGVTPAGAEPVLATPNLVMLYNPGQEYRRRLVDARGDSCIYVVLHAPALAELEAEGTAVRDGRMTITHAPSGRIAYLHQHLIARHLESAASDPLFVEEAALGLLRSVLRHEPASASARSATRASHNALAEAAKEVLAVSIAEQLSLHAVAARVGASPFHLARVFRRQTGYSLHEYRLHLRLRLALVRLADSRGELTSLAFELGFSSHSHFTDAFRRTFGVAPSAVREARTVRELLATAA